MGNHVGTKAQERKPLPMRNMEQKSAYLNFGPPPYQPTTPGQDGTTVDRVTGNPRMPYFGPGPYQPSIPGPNGYPVDRVTGDFRMPGTNFGYSPTLIGADGQSRDRVTGELRAPEPERFGAALANPQPTGNGLDTLRQSYPYSYGMQRRMDGQQFDPTPSTYSVLPPSNFQPQQSADEFQLPSSQMPINVLDTKSAPATPAVTARTPPPPAPSPVQPAANPFAGTDLGDYWQGEGDKYFGVRNGQNFFNGRLFSPEGLSQSTDASQPGGGYASWLRSSLPRFMNAIPANDPRRNQIMQLLAKVGGPLEGMDFGPR